MYWPGSYFSGRSGLIVSTAIVGDRRSCCTISPIHQAGWSRASCAAAVFIAAAKYPSTLVQATFVRPCPPGTGR